MQINKLITSEYIISSPKIGSGTDGTKLAYLADLHDVCVGGNNELLIENIKKNRPRAILLGGDMITQRRKGEDRTDCINAMELVLALSELAPVYYSIGNHERRWQDAPAQYSGSFYDFRETLESAGVRFLDNSSVRLHFGDDVIRISGLSVPMRYFGRKPKELTAAAVNGFVGAADPEHFQIILAHSPGHRAACDEWGADLILSGHYHGGQVRLPLIGGVITTGWALFPKYDMGLYDMANGKLIVSAGLGTHTVPLRINNPPEAVYIILRKA